VGDCCLWQDGPMGWKCLRCRHATTSATETAAWAGSGASLTGAGDHPLCQGAWRGAQQSSQLGSLELDPLFGDFAIHSLLRCELTEGPWKQTLLIVLSSHVHYYESVLCPSFIDFVLKS
jgi:hypothetical protein